MPNSASAKKRLRQNEKLRLHNRSIKTTLKSLIRKVRTTAAAGDVAAAEEAFRLTAKKLDQAGARRIIHPNRAARLKARLSHLIKKAKGQPAAV